MAQVVAMHANRRGYFISDQHSPGGTDVAARGIETTIALDGARRFADQAAVDSYVTAMGGTTALWVAMTLP